MMLAPLLARGVLLGAINLSSTRKNVFTPEHVTMIQEVASSVAIALQQAKLHEQFEARMAAAEALAEVSAVLRAAHTIDEVLAHILERVTAVIGGTSGSIFLLESGTNELVARGAYPPDPHMQTRRRQLGEGITGRVAATGRMFISEDLQQETMAHLIRSEIDQLQVIRSCVALPLRTQKHIVGVLHVGLPQKHTFTQTEVQLLTTISEIAGTALDRAMVLETLEQRIARRTSALEQANERLKELDQLKSKFVSDVSHELRTPVTNLKLYLDLLQRAGPEKQERYYTVLQQQTDRLIHLIESILDLSRLELGQAKIQFVSIDLNALIQQVTTVHQTVAEVKGLALTGHLHPTLPLIHGERNQLAQVITNLLSNAINYTATGQIQVQTHWDETTNHVCLTVSDTGMGISLSDKKHLFDRFYRGEHTASSDIPGNGLGLAIVKEIVDLHNGRIDIHSKIGQGSTFQVWLPCSE
jgi:signal transduction histidine kinase